MPKLSRQPLHLEYAVYDAGVAAVAGGYSILFPDNRDWLTDHLRGIYLDLIASLDRTVQVTPSSNLVYQSFVALPIEAGRQVVVVCWLDYAPLRPMARFLMILGQYIRLQDLHYLFYHLANHPDEWLDRKISSSVEIPPEHELPYFDFSSQLAGLDALMSSERVTITVEIVRDPNEALVTALSFCPSFLVPRLLIGHRLSRWPTTFRRGIVISAGQAARRESLRLPSERAGAAVAVGRSLRRHAHHMSNQQLLRLVGDLFSGIGSEAEVRSAVDKVGWQEIEPLLRGTWIKRLKYRNRRMISGG